MFAGPNGSGKSTLKTVLPRQLLGVYLNPDEIEREMRDTGGLDLPALGIALVGDEARAFFSQSKLLTNSGMADITANVDIRDGHLIVSPDTVNSYLASVCRNLPLTGPAHSFGEGRRAVNKGKHSNIMARRKDAGQTIRRFVRALGQ